ncbi:hypothetical protein BDW74DRAFT_186868 [Aspergillus multicolor]|uniref:RNA dependent RNA polymerase n=1 Tax=Aspergillus multicolor TaxID=41759 RepID=UPI003CCD6AD9
MEVFVHNLQGELSKEAFKYQLEPFMRALGATDYDCEKPTKKRFGRILFLKASDGERFLARHGEEFRDGNSRPISNLRILGRYVFCKPSDRKPDAIDLRALANEIEERINPSRVTEQEEAGVAFTLVRSSCGYTAFSDNEFAYIPEVQWQEHGTFVFKKRNLIVQFALSHRRIRIPLNTIYELVWTSAGSILITLTTVPLFFELDDTSHARLLSLGDSHRDIVGQRLVYEFQVNPVDLEKKLGEVEDRVTVVPSDGNWTAAGYNYKALHANRSWNSQVQMLKRELAQLTKDALLPFGILFLLQGLVYNAYLPPSIVLDLANRLNAIFKARKTQGKRAISISAFKKLYTLVGWPSPHGDPAEFTTQGLLDMITGSDQELHDEVIPTEGFFRSPQQFAYIHRVQVTPSRITLHGPEAEPLNRILRRFLNYHEYFIRVQFCEEDGQDVHFNLKINNDRVFEKFKRVFQDGFQIAGRTYTFLGFSHSSLRSHSAWFSAPFIDDDQKLQTYFTIITAIGKFSHITSPARCAARIGQAFSDTPIAINLKEGGISVWKIPDVEVNGRVYSDGVGTISQDAVDAIHSVLPYRKGMPTCFQIRLGGAKGMLALDSRLVDAKIYIRPSMIKFQVDEMTHVEICDSGSKPIPLVLNRQVIKIMEDMGVDKEWFFRLQGLRIEQLRKATATTRNTANFIKGQGVADCIRIYRLFLIFNSVNIDYKDVPFLRAVVEAMALRELRLLKHKARIPVEKGITLFGIMDETGFLQEKEVFVTYETMDGRFAAPPGHCRLLVTRSPALHDGDIQYAYHVPPPEGHPLRKHKNCIVFSQKGARDLPSQLSGGDLDGDLYNIIWDTAAAPKHVFAPADYPRIPPLDIKRAVEKEDMADFFVDFMQTDKLGVIATKHMILADQMELGTSHSECKKLAQLHSTAVDFSKTGVPVRLEEMPFVNRNRPDFLAPGPLTEIHDKLDVQLEARYVHPFPDDDIDSAPVHKYYRSEKILGKLYRTIDEHKIWKKDIHTTKKPNPTTAWKQFGNSLTKRCIALGASVNWKNHVETARSLRSAYEPPSQELPSPNSPFRYEGAISTAMSNFSEHPTRPITELEVFVGQILNNSGVQTRRQRERSIKLKDEFDDTASWILSQMRPSGPLTGYESQYDPLERCLACFHVASENRQPQGHKDRGWEDLHSFKIVAACAVLMEVEELEKNARLYGENVRMSAVRASPFSDVDEDSDRDSDRARALRYTPMANGGDWTIADINAMLRQMKLDTIT